MSGPVTALLAPGRHRAAGLADDEALLASLLRVETAWARVLARAGLVDADQAEAVARAAADLRPDPVALAAATEDAGNVVVPLVALLRQASGQTDAVHRGLTSQDVLDTALVLLARDALTRVRGTLDTTAAALARLARDHRDTIAVGRTLTQWAVPTTFGLTAAQWLTAVLDARDTVADAAEDLPVQCGGAAGTRALIVQLAGSESGAAELAASLAAELELTSPELPWHTRRGGLTRVADALVTATDAVGMLATDVALLGRPEVAEVREGRVTGRGGSSTMPQKRNPVLSVLVRSAAQRAPLLAAQLHLSAAGAVDQRPDGAWHAEWPALVELLGVCVAAVAQAAELAAGLEVDPDAMARRVDAARDQLLAESGGRATDPADYLGDARTQVDRALARWEGSAP